MMDRRRGERALSPVVGVALLVVIVVLLATLSAGGLFLFAQEKDPAPTVTMAFEQEDGSVVHRLIHESGATLDGDRIEVGGIADGETLAGEDVAAGDQYQVVPTDTTLEIVWTGDQGTSYVVWETSVPEAATVPNPDEGCSWVDTETDGGTDPITIDGIVVDCDVETAEGVEIQNGGTVIGETVSGSKDLDGDDATVYGDVEVDDVLNLQDGTITGSATSETADVKLGNATVWGDVDGEKVVEFTDGSSVDGDAYSETKTVKVLSSTVSGSISAGDSVKLDDAVVEGDVYIDSSDFDCTDSTINGQSCSAYSPEDPSDW